MAWAGQVVAEGRGLEGRELERELSKLEGGAMSMLLERAREWGRQERLKRDEAFERGIERGIEQGIERGIEQGIERGIERERRRLVHQLVVRRFGAAAADEIAPLLDGLASSEDMEAIADAVIECRSAEEFLRRVQDG